MALISAITFDKAKSLVRVLTRENPTNTNLIKYATDTVLLDAFNQAVKDINQKTRSRVVSNLETPIIYQGPSVTTFLSSAATAGDNHIHIMQPLNVAIGMTLTINDSTTAHIETRVVGPGYVLGTGTVPVTVNLTYNHAQGTGINSNNRLYDFPTGMNQVYEVDFNGIPLWFAQLDTLYQVYSIYGQGWYQLKGYPKYWYVDGNKFGVFPQWPTSGTPIILWSVSDPIQPTSSSDTTTTTGLDAKLDMAVVYWMCEYVMMSRREQQYAAMFNAKWKEALDNYQSNQISRMARENSEFLDHTQPYLAEIF